MAFFDPLRTGDPSIDRIQTNIASAFAKILAKISASDVFGGTLVKGISLTTGQDNIVSHGLGRIPKIWILSGLDSNATVWSPVTAVLNGASSNATSLNLRCSANCTVSLWVS